MARLAALALVALLPSPSAAQERPFERVVLRDTAVVRWDFDGGSEGWSADHDAAISVRDGRLQIASSGPDPYLRGPRCVADGELTVRLRARFDVAGGGQVFFATRDQPWEAEARSAHFGFQRGEWITVECPLGRVSELTRLRLDPGTGSGTVELDWIELRTRVLHPLSIEEIRAEGDEVLVTVRNHGDEPRVVAHGKGAPSEVAPGAAVSLVAGHGRNEAFAEVEVRVESEGLPPLEHVVHTFRPGTTSGLLSVGAGALRLQLTPDGRGARVEHRGQLVAILWPLVMRDGRVMTFDRVLVNGTRARLDADGMRADIEVERDRVRLRIRGEVTVEGPVVRTVSSHDRALFAGVEFLGPGESSSSSADVETDARFRFAPERRWVTMPLIATQTGAHTVALTWSDRWLQPTFSTPNALDGDDGSRASLRGNSIDAEVLVLRGPLEAVLELQTRSLPPPPDAPLDRDGWRALCRDALAGPLVDASGWGHCAEERWPRQPFADHGAAWFRTTGEIHDLVRPGARLVAGGSHRRDDSIYLLTGRAEEWLRLQGAEAARLRRELRDDGSFRYAGAYLREHHEDTSSGHCAARTTKLLEHARLTGDPESRADGLRALAFLARFRTPRGAQTWELSLHTPDVLAAAHAVRAHVLGFELTGERAWLDGARTWALRGLPFVYLWSDDPGAGYATIAVYGATNWRAPVWFGLPVQWCGAVYAQALAELAQHDDDPRWRTVALGVLRRAQAMQYPNGPLAGCLPDFFHLDGGGRGGPSINPCALLFLAATLGGEPAGLSVAVAADGTRVVAPFPVRIEEDTAVVEGHAGLRYQIVVDGTRVIDVESSGLDRIGL